MMLSQRVAQPLVQLARLIEEYRGGRGGDRPGGLGAEPSARGRCRVGRAAATLRRGDHLRRCHLHLCRHQDAGAGSHHLLDPGRHDARHRRADQARASRPITRLLQGINRDYSGFLKIDGSDLREINLRHLRAELRRRAAGQLPVPRLDPRQHPGRPPGPDAGGRGARRRGWPAPRNSSSACRTATRPTSRKARPTCRAARSSAWRLRAR